MEEEEWGGEGRRTERERKMKGMLSKKIASDDEVMKEKQNLEEEEEEEEKEEEEEEEGRKSRAPFSKARGPLGGPVPRDRDPAGRLHFASVHLLHCSEDNGLRDLHAEAEPWSIDR